MKNKKFISILAALLVLSGCSIKEKVEQGSKEIEKKVQKSNEEIYKNEILHIQQILDNAKSTDISKVDENFTEMVIQYNVYGKEKFGQSFVKYSFYDIDKDGSDEMLVTLDEFLTAPIAIYTQKDGKVESVLKNYILGNKSHSAIYKDGTISIYHSAGAFGGTLEINKYKDGKIEQVAKYDKNKEIYSGNGENLRDADIINKYYSSGIIDINELNAKNVQDFSIDGKQKHDLTLVKKVVNEDILNQRIRENGMSSGTLFGYSQSFTHPTKITEKDMYYYGLRLDRATDYYNMVFKETFNSDQVFVDIERFLQKDGIKLISIDESFEQRGREILPNAVKDFKTVVFFKKDKVICYQLGGVGGMTTLKASSEDKWTITEDTVIVPIVDDATKNIVQKYIVKFNNKEYTGGKERSKYYIEKVEK